MSPLLFAIFISDLGDELNKTGLGIQFDTLTNISAIFFADDIVLLAESEEDLNQLLGIVTAWTVKWKMDISVKKSKVMLMSSDLKFWKMFNTDEEKWDVMEVVNVLNILEPKLR